MRILHVTPSYEPAWHLGGVVRSVSMLCRGLAHMGHEVTVVTTDSGHNRKMPVPTNRMIELGGVQVYYFKTDISLKFAYSRALRNYCRQNIKKFDIVHLTSFWCYPAIPAAAAARVEGVPYLLSVRGTLRKEAMRRKATKKWLYFQAIEKKIITTASAIHYTTQMERELDVHHHFKTPSFIVPNGFEIKEKAPGQGKSEAKAGLGLNADAAVVTFIGRLHPQKSVDFLIKAISLHSLRHKEICLLLVGPDDGAERSLRALTSQLALDAKVRFWGPVDPYNRDKVLAASDILALVSTSESFGNVAVEAMLAGVPVMLSDNVGIWREVVADQAGVVVPLEVEAIAGALEKMLADPGTLAAMGQTAADAARRRYDIRTVTQQMSTAYEDILARRHSPGLAWWTPI
jgi:glycosyltransferase involved in cell wall biosynthesis